jgi:hypothetical protein
MRFSQIRHRKSGKFIRADKMLEIGESGSGKVFSAGLRFAGLSIDHAATSLAYHPRFRGRCDAWLLVCRHRSAAQYFS